MQFIIAVLVLVKTLQAKTALLTVNFIAFTLHIETDEIRCIQFHIKRSWPSFHEKLVNLIEEKLLSLFDYN